MAKAASKSPAVFGLDYLSHPDKFPTASVCAVYGDEDYLKREVLRALRREVLGGDDGEFSLATFDGDAVDLRDVFDALSTVSLFGAGRQLVIVEAADGFVSDHRPQLEDYVAKPVKQSVLVLEVKTWPANTRLAKAVASEGLAIECKSLQDRQIKKWLTERAKKLHGAQLEPAAADALMELLPSELGILDQEVAKLALLAGDAGTIDDRLVHEHAGGWRVRTTWDMIDAACDGRTAAALEQLDRLIAGGATAHELLPQMSYTLRQFCAAVEVIEAAEAEGQRIGLSAALAKAGVPPFKITIAERQLRLIGRQRARQLAGWLLAIDLAIKGHNSSPPRARIELERLIVRLSPAASEAAAVASVAAQ